MSCSCHVSLPVVHSFFAQKFKWYCPEQTTAPFSYRSSVSLQSSSHPHITMLLFWWPSAWKISKRPVGADVFLAQHQPFHHCGKNTSSISPHQGVFPSGCCAGGCRGRASPALILWLAASSPLLLGEWMVTALQLIHAPSCKFVLVGDPAVSTPVFYNQTKT